jgi:hypothetical protein
VPNVELSWQQAAVVVGCLAAVAAALPLARRPRLTGLAVFTPGRVDLALRARDPRC